MLDIHEVPESLRTCPLHPSEPCSGHRTHSRDLRHREGWLSQQTILDVTYPCGSSVVAIWPLEMRQIAPGEKVLAQDAETAGLVLDNILRDCGRPSGPTLDGPRP